MASPHPVPGPAFLPPVFTTQQASASGVPQRTQANRVAGGSWKRLRRGVFCLRQTWEAADATGRHLLACRAAQVSRPGAVVSHLSAAAAWGWPTPLAGLGAPWVTVSSPWGRMSQDPFATRVGTRRLSDLRLEVAELPSSDVRVLPSGLLVTTPERTVADCLRHLPLADAVAIADAAGKVVARDDVVGVLARQESWPYAARADAALLLVDPRRETWLESVGVVELCSCGVPMPEAQPSIYTPDGRFVGRPDLWWPGTAALGELDGWAKYRIGGLNSAAQAERALRVEKGREDGFRDLGFEVLRASSSEALRHGLLAQRWHRAVGRSDVARVRARIVPAPWPPGWPARP